MTKSMNANKNEEIIIKTKTPASESLLTPRFYTTDFEAMATSFRFIGRDEAQSLLAVDGPISHLFKDASDIWLKAKVIDAPASGEGRVSNVFIESLPSNR